MKFAARSASGTVVANLQTDVAGVVVSHDSIGLPTNVMLQLMKHAEYLHAETAAVSLNADTEFGSMTVSKVRES